MTTLQRANILLVDDRPANLLSLRALLQDLDQNLMEAASGEEALRLLLKQDCAVILLDVQMPGMDGFETATLIRSRERSRLTPIIFLTAFSNDEAQMIRGYAMGAVDYIFKPIVPAILRAKVSVFVDLFKKTQELAASEAQLRTLNDALEARAVELFREVVERQRAEEALCLSEERWHLALRGTDVGIWDWNITAQTVFFSSRWKEMLGYTDHEIGNTFEEWTSRIHPEDLPSVTQTMQAHFAGTTPFYVAEHRMQCKDGTKKWILARGQAIWNHNGEAIRMVGSNADVTARKEIERQKEEFVSVISHELRTPMTSLRGFTELMLERQFSAEKQREFLHIMNIEITRLGTLLNDFLDIQRIEAGRQTYHFAAVEVNKVVRESVAVFALNGGTHTFPLEVAEGLPTVRMDVRRLRQVLSNLLSNAVKFSPDGGVITTGARLHENSILLWVTDQGIGIPPEAISKLFSRFYRVDNTATRNIGGTGLGLALVKEIINAHGGRVWVETQLGQGSTFYFTLPLTAHRL
ncbi:MAG: response regulator [Deltaproteobacteria bacterium]|nr:response regulator [Deltaproteobacteria bacterium]